MIDEASRQRPDWIEGNPIKLEDGQDWHFPKITKEFRVHARSPRDAAFGVGVSPVETNRRFGAAFWAKHRAMTEAIANQPANGSDEAAEAAVARFQAVADVAWDLLERQYTLSEDELVELLPLILGDEDNKAVWDAIIDHALGISPKPSPAGNP